MKTAYMEVGSYCYCKCVSCKTHRNPPKGISLEVFKNRLSKLSGAGFTRLHLTGNDPVTNPEFREMVAHMRRMGIELDITTTLLDERSLDILASAKKLRVSMFGVYRNYQKFTGVDRFPEFTRNLEELHSLRDEDIIFNYTLMNGNSREVDAVDLSEYLHTTKMKRYRIQFFPAMMTSQSLLGLPSFFSVLDEKSIPYTYTESNYKKQSTCTVHDTRLYVKSNGEVYPCCMAGGELGQQNVEELCLGNIDKDSMKEITSKKLINLDNPICDECTPKYWKLMK